MSLQSGGGSIVRQSSPGLLTFFLCSLNNGFCFELNYMCISSWVICQINFQLDITVSSKQMKYINIKCSAFNREILNGLPSCAFSFLVLKKCISAGLESLKCLAIYSRPAFLHYKYTTLVEACKILYSTQVNSASACLLYFAFNLHWRSCTAYKPVITQFWKRV